MRSAACLLGTVASLWMVSAARGDAEANPRRHFAIIPSESMLYGSTETSVSLAWNREILAVAAYGEDTEEGTVLFFEESSPRMWQERLMLRSEVSGKYFGSGVSVNNGWTFASGFDADSGRGEVQIFHQFEKVQSIERESLGFGQSISSSGPWLAVSSATTLFMYRYDADEHRWVDYGGHITVTSLRADSSFDLAALVRFGDMKMAGDCCIVACHYQKSVRAILLERHEEGWRAVKVLQSSYLTSSDRQVDDPEEADVLEASVDISPAETTLGGMRHTNMLVGCKNCPYNDRAEGFSINDSGSVRHNVSGFRSNFPYSPEFRRRFGHSVALSATLAAVSDPSEIVYETYVYQVDSAREWGLIQTLYKSPDLAIGGLMQAMVLYKEDVAACGVVSIRNEQRVIPFIYYDAKLSDAHVQDGSEDLVDTVDNPFWFVCERCTLEKVKLTGLHKFGLATCSLLFMLFAIELAHAVFRLIVQYGDRKLSGWRSTPGRSFWNFLRVGLW
mmetsp:Transcript_11709/g.35681  ORF Transcript_11709/g.35681 Transcript_11709/m.35681 type:complete len:503 (-) Transcript_11709:85-1593(-)